MLVVHLVHSTKNGRARYRVKPLYRSPSFKVLLEKQLSGQPDVKHVSANPRTGKVLVLFNSQNDPQSIALLIVQLIEGGPKVGVPDFPPEAPPRPGKRSGEQGGVQESQGLVPRIRRLLFSSSQRQEARDWHVLPAEEVLASFQTSRHTGLTEEAARQSLKRHGPNELPPSASRSRLGILLEQFQSLPVLLLAVAAGLSVMTGGMLDAAAILSVVAINALIGFSTESASERTLRSLKNLVRPFSPVLRDGLVRELPLEAVAPGDLLVLRPGVYVAADCRVVEAHHLSVDESLLTGESMPVVKSSRALARPEAALADRLNMAYMGTLVTGGQGLAVVVATGRFTEMGLLQALIGEASAPQTAMEKQLIRLGNQLVVLTGAVCALVLALGLLRGYRLLLMLKTSISLAIAAVPEGLPAVAITTLAIGMKNMRRHRVLIRKLEAVETLGCIQTICLDKTGTITLNRMSVLKICVCGRTVNLEGGGPEQHFAEPEVVELLSISALCNETQVSLRNGQVLLQGSPTEKALIEAAFRVGVDVLGLREKHPLLGIQYRSENNPFMKTTHLFTSGMTLVTLKGSPLEVLSMCSSQLQAGAVQPLAEADRKLVEMENARMAGESLRVLGVAYAFHEGQDGIGLEHGFIWVGLIAMADPVRQGVKELIEAFHRADIDTVMITGDQTPTAYAIGKELDLSRGKPLEILDSTQLASIEPSLLKALAQRVRVFSRVSPVHKLQIVRALQQAGKVVAMTGDGINDGPALKAADIGIAMGRTGTDVARDVAEVVLEQDDLKTLAMAVSHGRSIYFNIQKSLHFLLSTNFSEVLVTFACIAAGLGHPLTTIQLLWINLISDIFPSLSLALEPPEPDVMERPPRNPQEPVLSGSDLRRILLESGFISMGALGSYLYGLRRYGAGASAGTLAFQSLVLGQLLHAWSCRSQRRVVFSSHRLAPNRTLTFALGGSVILQLLTLAVPGLRGLLGLRPIGLLDGAVLSGSALASFAASELTKGR